MAEPTGLLRSIHDLENSMRELMMVEANETQTAKSRVMRCICLVLLDQSEPVFSLSWSNVV